MIEIDTLIAWGATYKTYLKGETIFCEGGHCFYYYQLVSGKVSWMNMNEDGKEFIQNIIEQGECFGEIPLFDERPYAANSIATEKSLVIRLPKKLFIQLLQENQTLHFSFSKLMAQRIRYNFMLLKLLAYECPEMRIKTLLGYTKLKHLPSDHDHHKYEVDLTRQQIANMTGLRVETVIREMRNLERRGEIEIVHGKVFM